MCGSLCPVPRKHATSRPTAWPTVKLMPRTWSSIKLMSGDTTTVTRWEARAGRM